MAWLNPEVHSRESERGAREAVGPEATAPELWSTGRAHGSQFSITHPALSLLKPRLRMADSAAARARWELENNIRPAGGAAGSAGPDPDAPWHFDEVQQAAIGQQKPWAKARGAAALSLSLLRSPSLPLSSAAVARARWGRGGGADDVPPHVAAGRVGVVEATWPFRACRAAHSAHTLPPAICRSQDPHFFKNVRISALALLKVRRDTVNGGGGGPLDSPCDRPVTPPCALARRHSSQMAMHARSGGNIEVRGLLFHISSL